MAERYKLDGESFTKDPIAKRWTRQSVAIGGVGEAIYSNFWQIELSFGSLETDTDIDFLVGKWLAGGLHTAILPHPETGVMTGFTGVNIQDVNYEFTDVNEEEFADGPRMVLNHISLSATGTV